MTLAQAPTHRPPWLLVMAATMAIYAGISLIGALSVLRGGGADGGALSMGADADTALDSDVAQRIRALGESIQAAHRRTVRAVAVASALISLFTLYTVAAVLSRDRHGRRLALANGWLGIAYELATLPLGLAMARDLAARGSGVLAELLIASGRLHPGASPAEVETQLRGVIVAQPVVMTAMAIVWCAWMLASFGGRRGRVLYGLEAPRVPRV
jgi:hypothetical protein